MNRVRMFLPIVCVVAIVLGLTSNAMAQYTRGPDLEVTAKKLVNQCAGITRGELVLITGQPRDVTLLENIAVNVRKLGAFPLISVESEGLNRRIFDEVPSRFDSQTNEFHLKLAGFISAHISVDATENESLYATVPPERLAAVSKAFQPIMNTMLRENVKQVSLGNGLYPTASTARLYGMTLKQLETLFWDGVNADYTKLQRTGQTVRSVLAAGREARITNPNGTDLKFKIEGRQVFVSDGVISSDDIAVGGTASQVWLPAGEVYMSPVPGTAEGTVVVDRHFFQGAEITGLTLTFRAGKLTNMTAKSGLKPLKALYDASGPGKESFAFIDIGINDRVKIPAGSKLLAWMPAGMITIGTGNDVWAGGTNDSPFGITGFLPGSTLTVDGKTLVESGALRL